MLQPTRCVYLFCSIVPLQGRAHTKLYFWKDVNIDLHQRWRMVINNQHQDGDELNKCKQCEALERQIIALREELAKMKERAYHDVLTGLPNRRLFLDNLETRIARCQRYGDNSALLFLDVDNLKSINDGFGHIAGDTLLVRLSEILQENIRTSDIVARIGGDEFAILLDNLDADQVEDKIKLLVKCIKSTECEYQGTKISISAAIGYCIVGPKDSVEELMSRADAAMYEAKDALS